jgi:hypothetical protein
VPAVGSGVALRDRRLGPAEKLGDLGVGHARRLGGTDQLFLRGSKLGGGGSELSQRLLELVAVGGTASIPHQPLHLSQPTKRPGGVHRSGLRLGWRLGWHRSPGLNLVDGDGRHAAILSRSHQRRGRAGRARVINAQGEHAACVPQPAIGSFLYATWQMTRGDTSTIVAVVVVLGLIA